MFEYKNEDKSQYAIFEDYLKPDLQEKMESILQQVAVLVNDVAKLEQIQGLVHLIQRLLRQEEQNQKNTMTLHWKLQQKQKKQQKKRQKKQQKKQQKAAPEPEPEPEPVVVPVIEPEEDTNTEDENRTLHSKLQEQDFYSDKFLEIISVLDDPSIIVLKEQYTNFITLI